MFDEVVRKEFKTLSSQKPTIGATMMVKNESDSIKFTLNSVVNIADAFIIYDTGSTDNTIEVITNFAVSKEINVYIIKGEFEDFSRSRNKLLEYADTVDVHYLLLLDSNDEVRNPESLKKAAKELFEERRPVYLLQQQWNSGELTNYWNLRFIRARKGWRYKNRVHEYLQEPNPNEYQPDDMRPIKIHGVVLYQDRSHDGEKSQKRFSKDRDWLLLDHKEKPKDERTLYYLSQTCDCLGKWDEALFYSKRRLELEGFQEEKYHALMRCARALNHLGAKWNDVMPYYMEAYQKHDRAEPLVLLAEYYKEQKSWKIAYMFIKEACTLPYPDWLLLFVDSTVYNYYRWYLMGHIAYQMNNYEVAKNAIIKALEHAKSKDKEELEKLLRSCVEKLISKIKVVKKDEKKISEPTEVLSRPTEVPPSLQNQKIEDEKPKINETKEQFVNRVYAILKDKFPDIPESRIKTRAIATWKNRKA